MQATIPERVLVKDEADTGKPPLLHLELEVRDPIVVKYFSTIDEGSRPEKALEALRVGVIAIQSASPTLDTKIVEEKFHQVEESIEQSVLSLKHVSQV